jgi:5'-nucleotidase
MKNNIYFSNKENFEKIKMNFRAKWASKIHFLADFDRTLTKAYIDWIHTPALIWVLREKNILWDKVTIKEKELYSKYRPQEENPNIEINKKKEILNNWWRETFELLIKNWLTKNHIKQTIDSWRLIFREWINDFLDITNKHKIPVVIISATAFWTYSLDEYFKKYSKNYNNVEFIWNVLKWDNAWKMIWYKKPIIHSFNKDETLVEDFLEIYNKIKNRKNIILIWDSLWDHYMSDWFDYDNILKIWYLNEKEDELMNEYLERYDVVITGDSDMSFINEFLNNILT